MTEYKCRNCQRPYPETGLPHKCPDCGGIFGIEGLSVFQEKPGLKSRLGIWRYKQSFGLNDSTPVAFLGEGCTPIVRREVSGKKVYLKLEYLNPTGSFKDRGTAVMVSMVKSRGITQVVEDSSGNAGASLAYYASSLGINTNIFIPASTSGPKRRQIEASGAKVIPIQGERECAHQAALEMVDKLNIPYASHALLPFGISGLATIMFEVFEELNEVPGTIVAPVGHGSLFLGLKLGTDAIVAKQGITKRVKMVGVQPENCAPLVHRWNNEPFTAITYKSVAEGTQIISPVNGDNIIKLLDPDKDDLLKIQEKDILDASRKLAKMGFYVEPTSAMVWAALEKNICHWDDPIVLILTGSGLKYEG